METTVGKVLKDRRNSLRLTQHQVADRARITTQQYQKFESDDRNLLNSSFRLACRVISALEFDVGEFFKQYAGEDTNDRIEA